MRTKLHTIKNINKETYVFENNVDILVLTDCKIKTLIIQSSIISLELVIDCELELYHPKVIHTFYGDYSKLHMMPNVGSFACYKHNRIIDLSKSKIYMFCMTKYNDTPELEELILPQGKNIIAMTLYGNVHLKDVKCNNTDYIANIEQISQKNNMIVKKGSMMDLVKDKYDGEITIIEDSAISKLF